ncbi:MAG: M20 family metallopeptidase [Eubacteriales bacterium]|nr:M20 family metallopeptidase [Eubacteriales bacterium]
MKDLLDKAKALQGEMSAWRGAFHAKPELTGQEAGTHRMIRGILAEMGVPFLVAGECITVAQIEGESPGKCVAIRADTDALPVIEATGAAYASQRPGVMHACGHDVHMAIGLGAAHLLWGMRQSFSGRARVIFQPAEEGGHGAQRVAESGLVDETDHFFALHVWPQLQTGYFRLSSGPVCAATDRLIISVAGRGGHGAYPELSHSALLAAAETAVALKNLVPDMPEERPMHVMSMGELCAGSYWNVIPGEARLEGSLRTLDPTLRRELLAKIGDIAHETAMKHGCEASLKVDAVCRIVYNDEELVAQVKPAIEEALGTHAEGIQERAFIGDDFSDYRALGTCCYAHLGVKHPGQEEVFSLHHPGFNPDDAAMPTGLAGLCASVFQLLRFSRKDN